MIIFIEHELKLRDQLVLEIVTQWCLFRWIIRRLGRWCLTDAQVN